MQRQAFWRLFLPTSASSSAVTGRVWAAQRSSGARVPGRRISLPDWLEDSDSDERPVPVDASSVTAADADDAMVCFVVSDWGLVDGWWLVV